MAIADTVRSYESCDCDGEQKKHQDVLDTLDRSLTINSHLGTFFIVTGLSSTFMVMGALLINLKSKSFKVI